MKYWSAKADYEFIQDFSARVSALIDYEWQITRHHPNAFTDSIYRRHPFLMRRKAQELAAPEHEYQQIRALVVAGMLRAVRIASQLGVPLDGTSHPAPAIGGPIRPFNIYQVILNDCTYTGIDPQIISDTLIQTTAACKERMDKEGRRLYNPLCWIFDGFVWALRFPFMLLGAAGFDQERIEAHVGARIVKLVEVAAILYVLVKLGFSRTDLTAILKALF